MDKKWEFAAALVLTLVGIGVSAGQGFAVNGWVLFFWALAILVVLVATLHKVPSKAPKGPVTSRLDDDQFQDLINAIRAAATDQPAYLAPLEFDLKQFGHLTLGRMKVDGNRIVGTAALALHTNGSRSTLTIGSQIRQAFAGLMSIPAGVTGSFRSDFELFGSHDDDVITVRILVRGVGDSPLLATESRPIFLPRANVVPNRLHQASSAELAETGEQFAEVLSDMVRQYETASRHGTLPANPATLILSAEQEKRQALREEAESRARRQQHIETQFATVVIPKIADWYDESNKRLQQNAKRPNVLHTGVWSVSAATELATAVSQLAARLSKP